MGNNRKTPESIAFGKRLCEARLACGYTQAAIAKEVGVSKSTFTAYETGSGCPSSHVLAMLCKKLSVDAVWLFGLYPEEKAVQCPLMEGAKQPVGKHEAEYVAAEKAKREQAEAANEQECPTESSDLSESIATLDQLIDAMDELLQVMPGYLVEGNALREALHGDPNGDHAPAYISLLSSQPGVVNYYRDRTHMRELAEAGTISMEEYDAWYTGRRDKLAHTAVRKQNVTGAAADRTEKPRLKCSEAAERC